MTTSKTAKRAMRGIASMITIDKRSSKPLYQQIYDYLRAEITQGRLRGGELVPSTRELARQLKVSRLPVLNAYGQLLAEGHFETRAGSGTFVASTIRLHDDGDGRSKVGDARRRAVSIRAKALPKIEKPFWDSHLGPFQVGQPELKSFPIHIWSRLLSRYSRELRASALQYGDPMGLEELREVLAVYLRTSRGVRCKAEQIMVVHGSQQALDITTRALLDPGASAWVEEPGYWLVHQVLLAAGCKAVPVRVDEEGLNVAAGIKLQRDARAAFVTPSHQYPLGVTMSATRRFQLLEWADKAGAWIVEDDYDSEFRYDSMPIAALQGLDSNGRVIYTGTLSKVLFPALRLGYIVVPEDLVDRFAAVRRAMDICPSHASQAVLAAFIREGHFGRHIRRMRQLYSQRRQVLIEEIEKHFGPAYQIAGTAAGMHLTLLLPKGMNDRKIAMAAREKKLWLSALSESHIGTTATPGLVLGYGNTPAGQIAGAVRVLKSLIPG